MVRNKPEIICLCGSTRFKDTFEEINYKETLKGHIILTVGVFKHTEDRPVTREQEKELDKLHLRKIDMADVVFILNVGGYMGKGTIRELNYAKKIGKEIKYLEKEPQPCPN